VTLLLGFAQDAVGLIYVSIGCSVAAAVILIIAGRSAGAARVTTAAAPAPLDEPLTGGAGEAFPIANYDELLVTEVVPMLGALSATELRQVRAREEAGKARASVLRRIDSEIAARETPSLVDEPLADLADEPTMAVPDLADEVSIGIAPVDEEEPFPIEDYDDLRANEIMPLLPQLYADELERVRDHESAGANRGAILEKIDELLSPTPAPAKKATAAKKTSAPAKKTPAPKKAPVAKKAPAKSAVAKSTAAPVAKKAPAKKAAAPAKKTAAPKKAPAAKKAPAKKSS
jgi:hypothetical protein